MCCANVLFLVNLFGLNNNLKFLNVECRNLKFRKNLSLFDVLKYFKIIFYSKVSKIGFS